MTVPEELACTSVPVGSAISIPLWNFSFPVIVQDETGYTAHYMHLNSRSVAVGDVIKHGEIIGTVGSTGNSTGPHLHFGVKDNSGEWINPRFVLSDFVKN